MDKQIVWRPKPERQRRLNDEPSWLSDLLAESFGKYGMYPLTLCRDDLPTIRALDFVYRSASSPTPDMPTGLGELIDAVANYGVIEVDQQKI